MRPQIPDAFLDENLWHDIFVPDKALWQWCIENLLNDKSPLFNPDHAHLADAYIGFLWTNAENKSKDRRIVGQAEQPVFRCGAWQKARQEIQIAEWFGAIPNFVITLDANYCMTCDDTGFLMLLEHELYHCAQAMDAYGMPKFNNDTGEPVYTMRGHDVEEFIGVVERYGVGDPEGNLAKLVVASQQKPVISGATIAHCCGTCLA